MKITGARVPDLDDLEWIPMEIREYPEGWWIAQRGGMSKSCAYVFTNGSVDLSGIAVDARLAVRPVLELESGSVGKRFEYLGVEFQVVSPELAFCLQDIGTSEFRENWREKNATEYESSDVKKMVDMWFGEE